MHDRRWIILTGAALLAATPLAQAADPDRPIPARVAPRNNPEARCHGLRQADPEDENVAIVLFHVGPTGVTSEASVRTSSGSRELDDAAVSCVLKLHFLPATTLGEAMPVDSWQLIALRWTRPSEHRTDAAAAAAAAAAPAPSVAPAPPLAPAPPAAPAPAPQPVAAPASAAQSTSRSGSADVRVCIDETGKPTGSPTIVHSSGNAAFDEAALRMAGAGSYQPASAGGKPVPGCLQVTYGFEQK
jgi:TonB family protein